MATNTRLAIVYSRIYYAHLYRIVNATSIVEKSLDESWQEVQKRGEALAELLADYENRIAGKLPQVTGYAWVYPEDSLINIYPVYPLPGLMSFNSPLTLLVREDPVLTLGVLLHELSHMIVREEFKDFNLQETIMSSVAVHIVEDLRLPARTIREHFNIIHQHRFNEVLTYMEDKKILTTLETLRRTVFDLS